MLLGGDASIVEEERNSGSSVFSLYIAYVGILRLFILGIYFSRALIIILLSIRDILHSLKLSLMIRGLL